ncbi:MAG TPA: hypothetical protein PKE21_11205 [Flavobacteriales bacterium]|nr:hypothetical protein [Flavobacteriales bacterium]HMR28037.1 hypothetical protein [Flavobacteriales bacterium]
MERDDLTPEVLVALAAGHLRPATAEQARNLLAADPDRQLEYEGVQALVAELGPAGALEHLETAADRIMMRAAAAAPPTPVRSRTWVWAVVAAAASVLAVVYFGWLGPARDPERLAEAVIGTMPELQRVREELPPRWAGPVEQGEHAAAAALLKQGDLTRPRERLMLGYCLMHLGPAQADSAAYWLGLAAGEGSPYRDQALLYAGALAVRLGDLERARAMLARSRHPRAAELLERL